MGLVVEQTTVNGGGSGSSCGDESSTVTTKITTTTTTTTVVSMAVKNKDIALNSSSSSSSSSNHMVKSTAMAKAASTSTTVTTPTNTAAAAAAATTSSSNAPSSSSTAAAAASFFRVSKLYDREKDIQQIQDCCRRILGIKKKKMTKQLKERKDSVGTSSSSSSSSSSNSSTSSLYDNVDENDFASPDGGELLLITGPSGCGKTILTVTALEQFVEQQTPSSTGEGEGHDELEDEIGGLDGYFIRGKFDQFEKPESYTTFSQAFHELLLMLQSKQQQQQRTKHLNIEELGQTLLKEIGSEGAMSLATLVPEFVDIFRWKFGVGGGLGGSGGNITATQVGGTTATTAAAATGNSASTRLGSDPKRRFCHVVCRFISLVASKRHPIVLFLDDLQWADRDSLDLLSLLLTDSSIEGLMVVGACRGNEVSYEDNLSVMLRSMEDNQELQITEQRVENLSMEAMFDLVIDVYKSNYDGATLHEEDLHAIVPLVHSMSQGNAFHSVLLLRSLIDEGVLYDSSDHDHKMSSISSTITTGATAGSTSYGDDNDEEAKIGDITVTKKPIVLALDRVRFNQVVLSNHVDMVELLCQGLSKLDPQTRKVLQVAACLGAEFDLRLVVETSVVSTLAFAMDLGLIREKNRNGVANRSRANSKSTTEGVSDAGSQEGECEGGFNCPYIYTFTHDKIQQACYASIPMDERPQFHLSIGTKIFEAYASDGQWMRYATTIANQLRFGLDLIVAEEDKLSAAYIFEVAARNAFEKSSFTTSASYVQVARSLLPRRYWRDCYDRALAILTLEAEVLYATGHYDEIDDIVEEIVQHARSIKDKTAAYTTRIYSLGCRSRLSDALDLGFAVLKELGEPFPKSVGIPRVVYSLLSTMRLMKRLSDEEILTVQVMEDPMKLGAMRILNILLAYAFQARPSHAPLIVTRLVQLTLKYGQSAMSAPGFAFYGFVIASALQDLKVAVRSGRLALAFQHRYQCQEWIPRVYACVYGFINTLIEPLRHCVVPLTYASRAGLDSGDVEWACLAMYLVTTAPIWICQRLDDVGKMIKSSYHTFKERGQQMVVDLHVPYLQGYVNLTELGTTDPLILCGSYMDETTAMKTENNTVRFTSYLMKLYLACIFNEYEKAEEYAMLSRPYESGASLFGVQQRLFLEAMALLVLCRQSRRRPHHRQLQKMKALRPQSNRKRLQLARSYLKTLKKHASYHKSYLDSNLAHRIVAIEAGIAMVQGNIEQGREMYKESISIALKERVWGEQSLISEIAGMTLCDCGYSNDGISYLKQAKIVYEEWGAHRKVFEMEQQQAKQQT